jgi:hypothetical protein
MFEHREHISANVLATTVPFQVGLPVVTIGSLPETKADNQSPWPTTPQTENSDLGSQSFSHIVFSGRLSQSLAVRIWSDVIRGCVYGFRGGNDIDPMA